MTMAREQVLTHWVQQQLNDPRLSLHPLPGDASFRRYARILSQQKSYMLMDAPPEQEDCQPFIEIAEWLDQHQVRVPHIVAKDITQGFVLLEDFGDTLLSQVLNEHTVDVYYQQAMQQLLQLQQIPVQALPSLASVGIPHYDRDKLITEMRLFDHWFLNQYLQLELSEVEQQLIAATYELLAEVALAQPQVVVHRDYHSRNLMVLERPLEQHGSNDLGIIDFQDAVIGAYTYDLISILRDAYVKWPQAKVEQWRDYFWRHLPASQTDGKTNTDFAREFDLMAAQRHLKVLGIFIRLNVRDGKQGYMKDLPLVLFYLLHEIKSYPELAAFSEFLQQRVVPAFLATQPQAHAVIEGVW